MGKYGEKQRHRQYQLEQHYGISQQICQEDKQIHLLLRIQQFIFLNGDRFQFGILQSLNTYFQLIEQPGGEFKQQILTYDYKNEIENTFAKLPQTMFVLHYLQLVYDHFTFGSRQLVARATFPQAILIRKRRKNLITVHQIGNNITAL